MKSPILVIALLAFGVSSVEAQQATAPAQAAQVTQANVPAPTPYTVASQDANSTVWQREEYEAGPNGQTITHLRHYTEIASGLNFLDAQGHYQASKEEVDIQPDGTASATQGQYKVYFPADILNGHIQMITTDGLTLNSQPTGLAYDDGSNTVMIAVLTNSVGQIVNGNELIYTNAFNGLNADLLYIYRKSGFEQDVVFHQKPPVPRSLGLNPATTRIQVLTEFFNSPQPTQSQGVSNSQYGLTDTVLTFGQTHMRQGKAYVFVDGSAIRVPVYKDWVQLSAGTFLLEQMSYQRLLPALNLLSVRTGKPEKGKSVSSLAKITQGSEMQVSRGSAFHKEKITYANTGFSMSNVFVMDYVTINSDQSNYTFRGDETYFISGDLYLSGNTYIEGGAVLKYPDSGESFLAPDENLLVTCKTRSFVPAVFTSMDDNSVGDTINDSTGYPTNNGSSYIYFQDNSLLSSCQLNNLRMSYAGVGIQDDFEDGSVNLTLTDCQFVKCTFAHEGYSPSVELNNCLFSHCYCVNGQENGGAVIMNQVTADNSWSLLNDGGLIEHSALFLTNTILSSMTNIIALQSYPAYNYHLPTYLQNSVIAGATTNLSIVYSDYSYTNASLSGLYQAVGNANYYLASGSAFHNAGTTNIDPGLFAELPNTTTYPPKVYSTGTLSLSNNLGIYAQRDNVGNPDLGYHYDPLDYVFGGSDLYSNVTFSAGVAVGYHAANGGVYSSGEPYGISLNSGASFNTIGTATSPCWVVDYENVQEGTGSWSDSGWMGSLMFNGSGSGSTPQINSTFTKWGRPWALFFRDNWDHGGASLVNCEFYGGSFATYDTSYLYFTNCLLDRPAIYGFDQDIAPNFTMQNCTFYNGFLTLVRDTWQPPAFWKIINTSFDGTGFAFADQLNATNTETLINCNAYNTNNLSGLSYSYPYATPTNVLEVVGPNDQMISGYNWQTSWFGNFYLPTNSPIIGMGSTNANLLGMYHFTTQTNQSVEGTNIVTIGYHYVAADQYGNPLDSNGDGIPDYLEDANGDGLVDNGETNWAVAISSQPSSVNANLGDNVSFNVGTTGLTPTYAWYFNGTTLLVGATNAALNLLNINTNQAGNYSVVVSAAGGSITSSAAVLNVNIPAYSVLFGTISNLTFRSTTTFYLNTNITLTGTTILEGGTVIKFSTNGSLNVNGPLICNTAPFLPAVFTGLDDNSVGNPISQSSGNPTGYYDNAGINLYGLTNLMHDIRMVDLRCGLSFFTNSANLQNIQAVNCYDPILLNVAGATICNGLLYNIGDTAFKAVSGTSNVAGIQLTVDNCSTLANVSQLSLTNCLITATTNILAGSGSLLTNSTAILSSDSGVFQTVGAGAHYLAGGSPYRAVGTTNISTGLLAQLCQKTTWPPLIFSNILTFTSSTLVPQAQRDNLSTLDLGYHYDPIDYLVDECWITNCTLTLADGVVAGCYDDPGFVITDGSSINSTGSAVTPNIVTSYQTAQEEPISISASGTGPSSTVPIDPYHVALAPTGLFNFTKFTCLANGGYNLYQGISSFTFSNLNVNNCEFWGGETYLRSGIGLTAILKNNAFARSTINCQVATSQACTIAMTNNLFWGVSSILLHDPSASKLFAFNNDFDSCVLTSYTTNCANGYNAFLNCNTQLFPTNGTAIVSTNALNYQTSFLGTFYQPTNSLLIQKGSTTANLLGLYHFTTQTNQTPETNAVVDIGYHYVATDTNGVPLDSNGDGIPDYIEDANGDGLVDSGEIGWNLTNDLGLQVIILQPVNGASLP